MAIRASKSELGQAQQFDFLFHHFPRFSQQPNRKKRKKIELETNIETETKANSSPYLVRRVINFLIMPDPPTHSIFVRQTSGSPMPCHRVSKPDRRRPTHG